MTNRSELGPYQQTPFILRAASFGRAQDGTQVGRLTFWGAFSEEEIGRNNLFVFALCFVSFRMKTPHRNKDPQNFEFESLVQRATPFAPKNLHLFLKTTQDGHGHLHAFEFERVHGSKRYCVGVHLERRKLFRDLSHPHHLAQVIQHQTTVHIHYTAAAFQANR